MNNTYPKEKIVGGKFGLPVHFSHKASLPRFMQGNPTLLFNARSGIRLVVDSLQPKSIWLPSYLCDSMVSAVENVKTKIRFYSINEYLAVASNDFINAVEPNDVVLVVDYFGFPFKKSIIRDLKNKEAIVLHDCCQALFCDWGESLSDIHLYSPRKFLGVPDGGILHFSADFHLDIPELSNPPKEVFYSLFSAVISRREFDIHGSSREWYELFIQGEEALTADYHRMSELSNILLGNAFDYQRIASRRKENYQTLLSTLNDYALFDSLPDDVIPLGFPVIVENRDSIRESLFRKKIYPPIHWLIDEIVPARFTESHQLANKIMTIPCDQRYNRSDMIFITEVLKGILLKL